LTQKRHRQIQVESIYTDEDQEVNMAKKDFELPCDGCGSAPTELDFYGVRVCDTCRVNTISNRSAIDVFITKYDAPNGTVGKFVKSIPKEEK
jgi:hypothetical protein